MISKIKVYLYGFLGLLVTGLLIIVRVLSAKNSRLTRKVETTDARIKHAKAVMTADKEADEQADVRIVEARKEIDGEGHSSELVDPNDW